MIDLVVLVADNQIEVVVDSLLDRPEAIGIRKISWRTIREFDSDPGCAKRGVIGLSKLRSKYMHALLIFDYEGSGVTSISTPKMQAVLNKKLKKDWGNNARTVMSNLNKEGWRWSESQQVGNILSRIED